MSAMRLKSPALRLFIQSFIQGADQRKHQSSASLAFVRGIHRWPVNSPHKGPVTRKIWWRHHERLHSGNRTYGKLNLRTNKYTSNDTPQAPLGSQESAMIPSLEILKRNRHLAIFISPLQLTVFRHLQLNFRPKRLFFFYGRFCPFMPAIWAERRVQILTYMIYVYIYIYI